MDAWNEKYQQMRERLRKRNGPVELPLRATKLGAWLPRQRRVADDGKLLSSKQEKLEKLGIILSLKSRYCNKVRYNVQNQQKRNLHCEEFKDVCEKHGVFAKAARHPQLGSWVVSQRRQHRETVNGGKQMEPGRVKLLDELDLNGPSRRVVRIAFS